MPIPRVLVPLQIIIAGFWPVVTPVPLWHHWSETWKGTRIPNHIFGTGFFNVWLTPFSLEMTTLRDHKCETWKEELKQKPVVFMTRLFVGSSYYIYTVHSIVPKIVCEALEVYKEPYIWIWGWFLLGNEMILETTNGSALWDIINAQVGTLLFPI